MKRVSHRLCTGTMALLLVSPGASIAAQSTAAATTTQDTFSGPIVPGNFLDTTAKSGINFTAVASHTPEKYLIETMGSGVALFDYDNDGLLDIFVVNGAPLVERDSTRHGFDRRRLSLFE